MAEDVLQHDDRVVDEHPHAQREAAQGHHVQADVEQIAEGKRRQDGDRDRQSHRHGIAGIPKKEEEHQEGEDSSHDQRLHDVDDRLSNELRLTRRDLEAQRRELRPQLVEHHLDTFGHPDGVGARFLEDLQSHRRHAVIPSRRLPLRESVTNLGHLRQPHRCSSSGPRHDDVSKLIHFRELAQGAETVTESAAPHASSRRLVVGPVEGLRHLDDGHPVQGQQGRVQKHLDLPLESAADRGESDTVLLLETPGEDVLAQLQQLRRTRPRYREREDRVAARIRAKDDGPVHAARKQVSEIVEPFPHVQRGELHIRAPVELERHEGSPFT